MTALLTASMIANLALQKFIESGASEIGKKFSADAIAKMDTLLKSIWRKLGGKPPLIEVKECTEKDRAVVPKQVDLMTSYLQVAMDEDQDFATEVRKLADEINAGKLFDESTMTQNNYDQSKGWQTKVEGGTAYIGEVHIQNQSK